MRYRTVGAGCRDIFLFLFSLFFMFSFTPERCFALHLLQRNTTKHGVAVQTTAEGGERGVGGIVC